MEYRPHTIVLETVEATKAYEVDATAEIYDATTEELSAILTEQHGVEVGPDDIVGVEGNSPEYNWGRIADLELLDGHGIYIPHLFAKGLTEEALKQQSDSVREALEELCKEDSPDDEFYWENWEVVLDGFSYTTIGGALTLTLFQNGDLWVIDQTELDKLSETEREEFWEAACW